MDMTASEDAKTGMYRSLTFRSLKTMSLCFIHVGQERRVQHVYCDDRYAQYGNILIFFSRNTILNNHAVSLLIKIIFCQY